MSDAHLPELFEELVELDDESRRRRLEDLRDEDPALAAELDKLLSSPESAPSPIDLIPTQPFANEGAAAFPPMVGPYRLVRQVGRGGMGRVFLAEHETADFRRRVALKLIDTPAPDPQAVRRFRDEVRILAALDHPGIVRFLDGGRTGDGTWFLALEYVEGVDLLTHARTLDLDVEARLRLFLDVAEALEFAHSRGVIHRDLKPGNILVGQDARPRLLDFGISKLVDPSLSADPTTTGQGVRPLTPAYASPEQLAGEPVTTASDIYSLAVVLYELLTGQRPASASAGDGSTAGPEPPSAAARRASLAATGAARRLGRVSRDLDRVCLKALRLDPGERHGTVTELIADLRRHLERRGGSMKRVPSGRAALVGAAAVVALGIALLSGWGRSQPPAPSPAPTAAVRIFPFDTSDPPPAEASERRLAEAPEDLVAGAALALRLARDRRLDEARLAVGRMRQVPGAEGSPLVDFAEGRIASIEGEDQRALVFFTRARDAALESGQIELLGAIRTSRAATLSKLGQAEASLRELELGRLDSERVGDHRTLHRTLNGLALEYYHRGELDRSDAALEQALVAAEAAGIEPLTTLHNLAVQRFLRGRPDLAEPIARDLLELDLRSGDPVREGETSRVLSLILRDLGRREEADILLDQALLLLEPSSLHVTVADALVVRGEVELEAGRLEQVASIVSALEARAQRSSERFPLGLARSLQARTLALQGDFDNTRALFDEAGRLLRLSGNTPSAVLSDLAWVEAALRAQSHAQAADVLERLMVEIDPSRPDLLGFLAVTLRARLDAAAGRTSSARTSLAALGDPAASSPSLLRRLAYLRARGAIALSARQRDSARDDFEQALELAIALGHTVAALELRLDLAELGDPVHSAAMTEVRREAEALGLGAIARRAQRAGAG